MSVTNCALAARSASAWVFVMHWSCWCMSTTSACEIIPHLPTPLSSHFGPGSTPPSPHVWQHPLQLSTSVTPMLMRSDDVTVTLPRTVYENVWQAVKFRLSHAMPHTPLESLRVWVTLVEGLVAVITNGGKQLGTPRVKPVIGPLPTPLGHARYDTTVFVSLSMY